MVSVLLAVIVMNPANDYIEEIKSKGFTLIRKGGYQVLSKLLSELGKVIQQKDIFIKRNFSKLASSTYEMPLHTDHSTVDFIAWHCIEQTDNGGESLLSDISIAFNQLNQYQKELLMKVDIKNSKLFEGDLEFYPLVKIDGNTPSFYFLPWLAKEDESEEVKNALKELEKKLIENLVTLLLNKDDILVVDNKRILHGRNAILGSKNRFLKRYWIKKIAK